MTACIHGQVLRDIRAAVVAGDHLVEREDYERKLKLSAFAHYLRHFAVRSPYHNARELNEAMGYDCAKLWLAEQMVRCECASAPVRYAASCLGIDRQIVSDWAGAQLNEETVTALMCAVEVTLQHVGPLVSVCRAMPRHYHEYFCVYNRVWILGPLSAQHETCCSDSRRLMAVRGLSFGSEEKDHERSPLYLKCKLRNLLGAPAMTAEEALALRSERVTATFMESLYRGLTVENLAAAEAPGGRPPGGAATRGVVDFCD